MRDQPWVRSHGHDPRGPGADERESVDAVRRRRELMRVRRMIRAKLRDAAALLTTYEDQLDEFTKIENENAVMECLDIAAKLRVDPRADAYVKRTREGL